MKFQPSSLIPCHLSQVRSRTGQRDHYTMLPPSLHLSYTLCARHFGSTGIQGVDTTLGEEAKTVFCNENWSGLFLEGNGAVDLLTFDCANFFLHNRENSGVGDRTRDYYFKFDRNWVLTKASAACYAEFRNESQRRGTGKVTVKAGFREFPVGVTETAAQKVNGPGSQALNAPASRSPRIRHRYQGAENRSNGE